MTVSSTTLKNSYTASSSQTTFAYGFKIFANADLKVYVNGTLKSLTTHYTVTNAGVESGGNVVFGTGLTSGDKVVIQRDLTLTQATDYVENDPFPADSHETALDRLTFIVQQLNDGVESRSFKFAKTVTDAGTIEINLDSSDRSNKILAFNSSGGLSATQEIGTYKGTDATTTTAAYVQRDIIKSTTAGQLNNVYICTADAVVGDSLTDTDHFALLLDAKSAADSATAAASSATAAASSASAASTSASNASSSASTASTQATNASNSASAASTSASNAATSYDNFDDRYLGQKSSDPSADNDGASLLTGALYFNTSNNVMMVYTGSAWVRTTPTSSEQTNINTVAADATDIGNVSGSISNVNTVAGSISNVNTTAGSISNVNTVAGAISNVNTTASNIAGVNSFAERYRVDSSDPSSSLDEGDLVYNSSDNQVKYYNGSAWVAISADTDVKTLVSSNDTTAGYLNGKLVAGSNVTFTENNNGSNETLTIAATDNSVSMAIALG